MRSLTTILIFVLGLAMSGCQGTRPPGAASIGQTHNAVPETPKPYTRIFQPDENIIQLQIAVRRFVPARHRGAEVWLVGTSHVGEPGYYAAIQKLLNDKTIVLYEGINSGAHPRHVGDSRSVHSESLPKEPAAAPQTNASGGFSMQTALAKSLGLVFQLDAIDYDPTNFVNSDLSIYDIHRIMLGEPDAVPAPPGVKGRSDPSFDMLLQIMDGRSFLGSLFKMGIEFIGSSPQLQSATKYMLIETLGNLKGDFSEIHGLPPDMKRLVKVLIEARNQKVVDDLKAEVKLVPKSGSIAIFYGTGHMEDMEKRLVGQLSYRAADELWLTAFSADVRKTGMSSSQLKMMQNLIQWQMNQGQ